LSIYKINEFQNGVSKKEEEVYRYDTVRYMEIATVVCGGVFRTTASLGIG
jgi:hypothetical protein